MLLFKSVSEQEDDEKSAFRQIPSSLSLDRAAETLLQLGDLARNQ
jgi:hypothetical protein